MKISAQEEYGLRCLLRVAKAKADHAPTIPEIASAERLSAPYVAKLLSVLRQAGLIDSVRGRSGGYHLAANAAEVTLGSVLLVLGEPLYDDPGYCQRHSGTEAESGCVHHDGCNLRAIWQTLEEWMRHALNEITLADLLHTEHNIPELLRSRLMDAVLGSPSNLFPMIAQTKD